MACQNNILFYFRQLLTSFTIQVQCHKMILKIQLPFHQIHLKSILDMNSQTFFCQIIFESDFFFHFQQIFFLIRFDKQLLSMMSYQPQQMSTWQMMYNQLLNEYSTLACSYHQQAETNMTLYQRLEGALQERITLLQQPSSPLMPTLTFFSSSHHHEDEVREPPTKIKPKREKKRVRRNRNTIRRNGYVFKCTYSDCKLTYHSSVSMNQHIKSKHNGGTKKERQAYAKLLIESEEKGESAPIISINFPPNFMDEYRKKYSYIKKYNM